MRPLSLNEWLFGALFILASLVCLSFAYIAIITFAARRQLRKSIQKQLEPEVKDYWLERRIGKGLLGYSLFAVILPLVAILFDYILPMQILGLQFWPEEPGSASTIDQTNVVAGLGLTYIACVLGLFLVRKVYNVYRTEVLPEIIGKLKDAKDKNHISFGLQMFGTVAGSKTVYSITNIVVTAALFFLANYITAIPSVQSLASVSMGIDLRSVGTGWLVLLFCTIMIGMVGPMATIMSCFVIYCAWKFRDKMLYDVYHLDKCGGFKSLGTLATWESSMATVAPGVGLPTILLTWQLQTPTQNMINTGFILFLVFCTLVFFFVPLIFLHETMKRSRRARLKDIWDDYGNAVTKLTKSVKDGEDLSERELRQFYLRRRVLNDANLSSDWAVNYLMISKVIVSTALPAGIDLLLRLLT